MDATYFGRWGCCLVFKEGSNIIFWEFALRESYSAYVYGLSRLVEMEYEILSVTSDKHGSLVSAVKSLFPEIPHQYCTVHVQRRCQSLLTQKPETKAGEELLELVLNLNQIKTPYERDIFLKWLWRFKLRYESFINQRTYAKDPHAEKKWWYTHKNLRKAFRHLETSTQNLFFYIEDSNIPKDTNGLEAEFTHLKIKLRAHCGLTRERRQRFISWYWYLKSTRNVH